MLDLPDIHLDISTTEFYKEIFAEGKLEGKQETLLFLLQQRLGLLNFHLIEQIKFLNLKQADNLLAQLFNFQQIEDLASWLKQLNH